MHHALICHMYRQHGSPSTYTHHEMRCNAHACQLLAPYMYNARGKESQLEYCNSDNNHMIMISFHFVNERLLPPLTSSSISTMAIQWHGVASLSISAGMDGYDRQPLPHMITASKRIHNAALCHTNNTHAMEAVRTLRLWCPPCARAAQQFAFVPARVFDNEQASRSRAASEPPGAKLPENFEPKRRKFNSSITASLLSRELRTSSEACTESKLKQEAHTEGARTLSEEFLHRMCGYRL